MPVGKVRQYPDFLRLFHTSTPLRSVELRMKKESMDLVASTGHLWEAGARTAIEGAETLTFVNLIIIVYKKGKNHAATWHKQRGRPLNLLLLFLYFFFFIILFYFIF